MPDISTTQSFADGDTVTAAKLNNIIAGASITSGAVTNAKLATDAVELDNMANNSVDTAELVNNAVQNSKLETMAAKTVKANATNATANPTDVAVATSELLAGTSNSLNAVSFTTDLEMTNSSDVVVTDNTAAKVRVAPTLIGGKSSVTADSSDELLIKDATDGALKRATAQSVVQSQVATTGTSGVVRVSDAAKLITASSAITADVVGITTAVPMLAKAWCYFTTNVAAYNTAWGSVPGAAQTVVSAATFNIAAGIHTKDGTTSTGGVQQTAQGTFRVTFSTALPNTNYIATGNGHLTGLSNRHAGIKVTSKATTHFDFETTSSANTDTNNVAEFQLVVFGLGS